MKYNVSEIIDFMNSWAKPVYQESWDNSGSQILVNNMTDKVVVALDLTDEVLEIAIRLDAKLIITHHPMIFGNLKSIDENTYIGKNIIKAIKNNISIYSAHTSLDIAQDGVNDTLCELIGLSDLEDLSQTDSDYYIGKVGRFKQDLTLEDIVELLEDKLNFKDVKVYGKKIKNIEKIALCGGSGASMIKDAINKDANIFITGDIKHHDAQFAYENNVALIDISHYHSEKVIIDKIEKRLKENFEIITIPIDNNIFEVSIEK